MAIAPTITSADRLDLSLRLRRILGKILLYAFLIGLAAVTLLPFVYAFFASFKPLGQMMSDGPRLWPRQWRFENYAEVWRIANFSRYFLNTIFVSASVIVLDLICSSMLGYVLARKRFRLVRITEGLFAFTIFLGLGTISLYPILLTALKLRLLNLPGIVIVELAGLTVIHTLLIKAYCQSLSPELYEAAQIDGCGFFGTFWRIAFPLIRPILAVVAIFAFQASWNDFQVPFVFTIAKPELRTIVVGVYALRSSSQGANAWHLMLAGTVISLIPMIAIFLSMQKYFMRGMTEGALKG